MAKTKAKKQSKKAASNNNTKGQAIPKPTPTPSQSTTNYYHYFVPVLLAVLFGCTGYFFTDSTQQSSSGNNGGTQQGQESGKRTADNRNRTLEESKPTEPPTPVEQVGEISEGGVQVIEPYLDPQLNASMLSQLSNRETWIHCDEGTAGYNWWVDKDATPSNLWEELAMDLWNRFHPEMVKEGAGFEYWCNVLDPEMGFSLGWHQDKDEGLFSDGMMLQFPLMGAVFYGYPHKFIGGDLEVVSHELAEGTKNGDEADVHVEEFKANFNRLIFLNVTRYHRVAPIHKGTRVTFAVNLWRDKPTKVSAFGDPIVESSSDDDE